MPKSLFFLFKNVFFFFFTNYTLYKGDFKVCELFFD